MATFKIKATETITYIHDIEAETLAEAIAMVEDGESDDMTEHDSSAQTATEYTIEGQMGWNEVTDADRETNDTPVDDGEPVTNYTLRINGIVPDGYTLTTAVKMALNVLVFDAPLGSWGEIQAPDDIKLGEFHFETE